jgi:AraC-like DNA-binding protein
MRAKDNPPQGLPALGAVCRLTKNQLGRLHDLGETMDQCLYPGAQIRVWDTRTIPFNERAEILRSKISHAPLSWTHLGVADNFEARSEVAQLPQGVINRVATDPITTSRTIADISNSTLDCFIAAFCIAGELTVEQDGFEQKAGAGDLIVYQSTVPARVRCGRQGKQRYLGLWIPIAAVDGLLPNRLTNVAIPRRKIIGPLHECYRLLANNLTAATEAELSALYSACVSLIPIAWRNLSRRDNSFDPVSPSMRRVLEYVDLNLTSCNLSAGTAAVHLALSIRQIHNLFAMRGTTFRTWVTERRLDCTLRELQDPTKKLPISELAFRWGFNDLSTFNRAFKRRYGWSPRRCRDR